MRCLRLVVGEFEFIFSRLLVVNITCVASFQMPELLNKDIVTFLWDVEDGSANLNLLGIQRPF